MKTEFLRKEHWHQGEHCTFAKFTGDDGTELFADFESETKVRVWGKVVIPGHEPEMIQHCSLENGKWVAVTGEAVRLPSSCLGAISEIMFSDRYQLYRKQQMAFEHLKDVLSEMEQLEAWKTKFLVEVTETTALLEKFESQEEISLTP